MNRTQFIISQESGKFVPPHRRVIVFAPHPDDEVIGAFSLLTRFRAACFIVFVTDGAPLKLGKSRAPLRRKRQSESNQVAALLRIPAGHVIRLRNPDQGTTFQLPRLIIVAAKLLRDLRPDIVIIPAYEGGHPDHDSTAFSVHQAAYLLGKDAPLLIEMCLYHGNNCQFATSQFLQYCGALDCLTVELSASERNLKQAAFIVYRSQAKVLQCFPTDIERFRLAPKYDFHSPPHRGPLFYERFDWGVSGAEWRELAARASSENHVR
jgi:LmbE family N-acetylglucosaminyl deacetylase